LLQGLLLQADFTHISAWQRLTDKGEKQLLFMCGDTHDQESMGLDQDEQITKLMAANADADDCIIAEDMNDAAGLAERFDAYFEVHPHEEDRAKAAQALKHLQDDLYESERVYQAQQRVQAALFLLPYCARNNNVPIHNVDFRQFLTCDAPRADIAKYTNGNEILPWMLERIVHDIAQFNDGPLLNEYYKDVVARYKPFMADITKVMREEHLLFQDLPAYFADLILNDPAIETFSVDRFKAAKTIDFDMMIHNLGLITDHLKTVKERKPWMREDLLMILTDLFDLSSVELFDAVVVHELCNRQINSSKANTVFVCVGQAHAEVVEEFLPELGYTLLDETVDVDGVNIEKFCTPILTQSNNPLIVAWSYVVDTVNSVVGYVTELFV
jgi:hypothetical protein